ncbi:MAG: WYL domain-containing protein [Thermoanaerobaculia bacterium]
MAFKDRPYFRRILELDDVLRQGKKVTATTLAERWETSTKTVQRLIDNFRDEFRAPLEWDARRGTYLYSEPGWHLPWLAMEGADLFAVGVAMKVLQLYEGTPAAKDLKAIFERLSKLMPPEVRVAPSSFVEKLYIRQQAQRPVDPKVWDAVATALREKVALTIDYKKPTGEFRKREIEPLHLVLYGMDWFLLAKDPGDDVVKTFYLSRMKAARVGSRRFSPPKGFRPEEHFGETIGIYVGKPHFRFRVRFDREVAEWITEVRWHEKQKLVRLPDGGVELELPASARLEARRFVLSFGKHAEVLGPPELVAEVKEHVRALAAMYGDAAG